jgi:hypothetical protein
MVVNDINPSLIQPLCRILIRFHQKVLYIGAKFRF